MLSCETAARRDQASMILKRLSMEIYAAAQDIGRFWTLHKLSVKGSPFHAGWQKQMEEEDVVWKRQTGMLRAVAVKAMVSKTTNLLRGSRPPGFIEYKPDTELIFPPALARHEFKPLAFGDKRKRWYRPVTLQQLLEIKSVYPSAKIIGGSTETQIEIKFKAMQYSASVFVGDIA